jgi:hypothetical protein
MKSFLTNLFGWIACLMLLLSCNDANEEEATTPSDFRHPSFNKVERRNVKWEEFSVNLDIPDCFIRENHGTYSLTNKMMFACNDAVYLTFDGFSKESIEEYRYYYQDDVEESESDAVFMLNYATVMRMRNLDKTMASQITELKTNQGNTFFLKSVVGEEMDYSEELFYLFGAIEQKDQVILVQAIFNAWNMKFLLRDFKKIYSTLKVN